MSKARLMIRGDQTVGLNLKENIIHAYSQDAYRILSCKHRKNIF